MLRSHLFETTPLIRHEKHPGRRIACGARDPLPGMGRANLTRLILGEGLMWTRALEAGDDVRKAPQLLDHAVCIDFDPLDRGAAEADHDALEAGVVSGASYEA